jgi:hypothetical protein
VFALTGDLDYLSAWALGWGRPLKIFRGDLFGHAYFDVGSCETGGVALLLKSVRGGSGEGPRCEGANTGNHFEAIV